MTTPEPSPRKHFKRDPNFKVLTVGQAVRNIVAEAIEHDPTLAEKYGFQPAAPPAPRIDK